MFSDRLDAGGKSAFPSFGSRTRREFGQELGQWLPLPAMVAAVYLAGWASERLNQYSPDEHKRPYRKPRRLG